MSILPILCPKVILGVEASKRTRRSTCVTLALHHPPTPTLPTHAQPTYAQPTLPTPVASLLPTLSRPQRLRTPIPREDIHRMIFLLTGKRKPQRKSTIPCWDLYVCTDDLD
ncbi:hypothetical protein Hamer_G017889 [Homarus americanus]|uniref:Uncharacterized protein n=1 Tax=Homarus americanus TaxID=6706 RepID=A0A8J5N4L6_HOMAM|nr:hypothetical protein Hamer_G017889 [Homarus americanus]